ncbi:MAG TPA: LapA family protein [Ignavibacteriaceae bacterium]|nr:LapA family protein [Ignavibacteriaceae bacterium]
MRTKIVIVMILIILFTVFVSQNTDMIDVSVFLWKFQMSTIVLMSISFFIGIILGFIVSAIFGSPKKKISNEANAPVQ